MKLIAGSILILLVMIQSFTSWIIVAEYTINKEYIAKNLCINKEKTKLHCNGKCQLMKKLVQEENQNSSSNSQTGKIKMDVLFVQEVHSPSISNLIKEDTKFNAAYIVKQPSGSVNTVFHPPATA
jgi:hypothetical protein